MAKYEINRSISFPNTHKQTVEAGKYTQEGEYFVFYAYPGPTKVLTLAAKLVHTIDTVNESKS